MANTTRNLSDVEQRIQAINLKIDNIKRMYTKEMYNDSKKRLEKAEPFKHVAGDSSTAVLWYYWILGIYGLVVMPIVLILTK